MNHPLFAILETYLEEGQLSCRILWVPMEDLFTIDGETVGQVMPYQHQWKLTIKVGKDNVDGGLFGTVENATESILQHYQQISSNASMFQRALNQLYKDNTNEHQD